MAFGLDVSYLSRPVVLEALAPDPSGRSVLVVDDVVDASLSAAYSPAPHLDLGLVLPFALYRSGTGLSGVTSQGGPSVAPTVFRDLRIGASHDLLLGGRAAGGLGFSAVSRLELALPTGDETAFAGDRSPVLAPGIVFGIDDGLTRFEAMGGARLREPVDIGGATIGSQIVASVGISVEAIPHDVLSASIEAWALPNFLSTKRTLPDGSVVTSGAQVPAEWLASVTTKLSSVTLAAGGGTAIPLSSETRVDPQGAESTEHFAAVGTPRFRVFLTARWEPTRP
jgi:hypothetical protein